MRHSRRLACGQNAVVVHTRQHHCTQCLGKSHDGSQEYIAGASPGEPAKVHVEIILQCEIEDTYERDSEFKHALAEVCAPWPHGLDIDNGLRG